MATIEIRYRAKCKDCKHLDRYYRVKKNGEEYKYASYRCKDDLKPVSPNDYSCRKFELS